MWRSSQQFARRCSLRTWVFRVAHNTAVSHLLRQRRAHAGLVSLDEIELLAVHEGRGDSEPTRHSGPASGDDSSVEANRPASDSVLSRRNGRWLDRRDHRDLASQRGNKGSPDQGHSRSPISDGRTRRKTLRVQATMRRGFRIAALLMIFLATGYASFLYFFPGMVQRIGATLTLAGYLYCAVQLRKRFQLGQIPERPAAVTCAAYRMELTRKLEFGRTAWRTFLLPFVPGPAIFIMGFLIPEQGLAKAVALTAALIASPFVAWIPVSRGTAEAAARDR